jgi:hypothetical protein
MAFPVPQVLRVGRYLLNARNMRASAELSWCHWLAAFARRLQRNLTTVPEKPLEHPSRAAYTNGTAAEESERLMERYRKKSHKGHSDVWDSLSDGIGLIAIQIC